MDHSTSSQKFGLIKGRIVSLKEFTAKLTETQTSLMQRGNEFEVQQQLDNDGLYVKQIPSDANMLFRAFSDALYFSQSRFKEVKLSLCKFVQKHANQMSKLLSSFYDDDLEIVDYISKIKKCAYDFELELVLLCELYNKNAEIYFQSLENTSSGSQARIGKYIIDTGSSDVVRLSLLPSNFIQLGDNQQFEWSRQIQTIYKQEYINKAALAQTLLLNCIFEKIFKNDFEDDDEEFEIDGLDDEDDDSVMLYSNVEFKQWKSSEKEKKAKQDSLKQTQADISKSEAKESSSKLLSCNNECYDKEGTPNTTNSSYNGSSKGVSLRTKLNPKSSVYNANQGRPNPDRFGQYGSQRQVTFSQHNALGNQMSSTQLGNYNQGFSHFSPGIVNQIQPSFPHERFPTKHFSSKNQLESHEMLKKYAIGNVSTPFTMSQNNQPKSKSHLVPNPTKFSSDTKIFTPKAYTLFGDNELEEVESSHPQQETDSEDDSKRVQNFIMNNVLDENDYPGSFTEANQKLLPENIKYEDKEYDCGSVSSGSEKDCATGLKIFNHVNDDNARTKGKTSSTGNSGRGVSGSNNSGSSGNNSSKKVLQEFHPSSPDFKMNHESLKKEGQGYNSSKLVPTSNFDSITATQQMSRASPDKRYYSDMLAQSEGIRHELRQPVFHGHFQSNNQFYQFSQPQGIPSSNPGYSMQYPPMQMHGGHSGMYMGPHGSMQAYAAYPPSVNTMYQHHFNPKHSSMSQKDVHITMNSHNMSTKSAVNPGIRMDGFRMAKPKQFSSSQVFVNTEIAKDKYNDKVDRINSGINNLSTSMAPPGLDVKESSSAQLRQISNTNLNQITEEQKSDQHSSKQVLIEDISSAKKRSKKTKNKKDKRRRERLTGKLKFFDEGKNYGFMVLDSDNSDMFVHYDDLKKTLITKDLLVSSKNRFSMHFTFHVFEYEGKYKSSKKAVDIKLVSIYKIDPVEDVELAEPVLYAQDIPADVEITEQMLCTFFNS